MKRHFCATIRIRQRHRGECPITTSLWNGDVHTLKDVIVASLDDDKATDIAVVDLQGKASLADMMIVADGRSTRHVGSMAEKLSKTLKAFGADYVQMEGLEACDWALIDAGDIVVHLFKPGIRELYNLEKMWTIALPASMSDHATV